MAMKIPLLMGNGLVATIETQLLVSHMRLVGQRYRWQMRVDSYTYCYTHILTEWYGGSGNYKDGWIFIDFFGFLEIKKITASGQPKSIQSTS